MSYVRQLIDQASEWLRQNPDPKSPFVHIPGLDKNRDRRVPDRLTSDQLLRYEIAAGQTPAIKPHLAHLKTLVGEVADTRRTLNQHEAEFENELNLPKPGQDKYNLDVGHVTVGRWCLSWARSGYNTFELSPDFVAAMLLTDARALDVDLVRLPFPAILITMPDGFAIGVEGRSYTKIHVTEISASDLRVLNAGDKVWQALADVPREDVQDLLRELQQRSFASPTSALLKRVETSKSLLPSKDDLRPSAISGSLHIYATDGDHVLDTLIDRKDLTWDSFDDLPDTVTDDADKIARQTLRQVVFGMLAYANAIDRSVEPRDSKPRRPSTYQRTRTTPWTVGRTVRIDPQLVRLARSGDRASLFRLKHRFIVRGHYRNQAHGPQRSLRTSKWIEPHWKGPQDGAELVHTYKLDEPKERPDEQG